MAKKAPWYADGLSFSCTQCGRCCGGAPGYVWVDDPEIHAIAGALEMHPLEFMNRHTRRVGVRRSLREFSNGDCHFLIRDDDGKTRCSVHAARPLQCRTWPFWASNLSSRRAWEGTARDCPGMNHGEHFPLPVIQAALERNKAADLRL